MTNPRQRALDVLREALRDDPTFAPLAELALEQETLLGQGGMGAVYRVKDRRLDRPAALKLMHADRADEDEVKRFRREVEITARLDHPAIPPVYEAGSTAAGQPFLLMKCIEGESLKLKVRPLFSGGKVPSPSQERELLEVLVKIGEGAAYAHSQGIVHRDLKPANVMVGRFGEVLVMDWGLARDLKQGDEQDVLLGGSQRALTGPDVGDLTLTGAALGTPGYMPAEQAKGEAIDARADVWALGAILTCLLTGRSPVEGASALAKLDATAQGKIVLPRDRRPDVAPELNSIAVRALALDPERRYPSAEAFVADLRAHLAGEPVSAHRYSGAELLRKRLQRHPVALAAICFGLVTLVAISGATGLAFRQQAERAKAERERLSAERERDQAEARRERELTEVLQAQANTANARNELLRSGIELGHALAQSRKLWPAKRSKVPTMEAWLREVKEHIQRLEAPGAKALLDPGGTGFFQTFVGHYLDIARDPSVHPGRSSLNGMRARLELARRQHRVSLVEGRVVWERALEDLGSDPRFRDHNLSPVEGLVPLGKSPQSGLWEFWHVASGARPEVEGPGRYRMRPETGLVFVLCPGGSFAMGSTEISPRELPLRTVRVSPFFLSKYELTYAQWARLVGLKWGMSEQPEKAAADEERALSPAGLLAWSETQYFLPRWGLGLPSEAQWEFAARGGTRTAWWSGSGEASLEGCENLADLAYSRAAKVAVEHAPWQDTFHERAPVGSFRPNPFGLYDVGGNVSEWTQDAFGPYREAPLDGTARVIKDSTYYAARGGNYTHPPRRARLGQRQSVPKEHRRHFIGVRPLHPVER